MDGYNYLITKNHTIAILAFNAHDITMDVLKRTYKNNPDSKILLFDNGSSPSFEKLITNLDIEYYREEKNIYVNPAWNKIFDLTNTSYLTILNNDCFVISKDYFPSAIKYMEENNILLSSCKTMSFKSTKFLKFDTYLNRFYSYKKINFIENARRQGWLMTLNLNEYKKLNYKIPDYLKIWYGDDWIWGQVRGHKKRAGVFKNYFCGHVKSYSTTNPDIQNIINDDIEALKKNGDWFQKISPLIHTYKCKSLKMKHV